MKDYALVFMIHPIMKVKIFTVLVQITCCTINVAALYIFKNNVFHNCNLSFGLAYGDLYQLIGFHLFYLTNVLTFISILIINLISYINYKYKIYI